MVNVLLLFMLMFLLPFKNMSKIDNHININLKGMELEEPKGVLEKFKCDYCPNINYHIKPVLCRKDVSLALTEDNDYINTEHNEKNKPKDEQITEIIDIKNGKTIANCKGEHFFDYFKDKNVVFEAPTCSFCPKGIRLFNPDSGKTIWSIEDANSFSKANPENGLATIKYDKNKDIDLVELWTGKKLATYQNAYGVYFPKNKNIIVVEYEDGLVEIIGTNNLKPIKTYKTIREQIVGSYSDNKPVMLALNDGTSGLLNLNDLSYLNLNFKNISDYKISPDGKYAILDISNHRNYADKCLLIKLDDQKIIKDFGHTYLHDSEIYNNQIFLTKFVYDTEDIMKEGELVLDQINLEDGKLVNRYNNLKKFSPNEKPKFKKEAIIITHEDDSLSLLNIKNSKKLHFCNVEYADFNKDGKFLIVRHKSGKAKLINVETMETISEFQHIDRIQSIGGFAHEKFSVLSGYFENEGDKLIELKTGREILHTKGNIWLDGDVCTIYHNYKYHNVEIYKLSDLVKKVDPAYSDFARECTDPESK